MNKPLTVIYNPYVNSIKNKDQLKLFKEAQIQTNIKLDFVRSDEVNLLIKNQKYKLSPKILFLDKNVVLARLLEQNGYRLYNKASAIEICDNKALTHVTLSHTIKQPKTLIGILTFGLTKIETNNPFVQQVKKEMSYPLILKEVYGSFGHQVYLIQNELELINKLNELNGKQFIIQEFLNKHPGESIRVLIIDKKIYGTIKQKNNKDFRSNLTSGSQAEVCKINKQTEKLISDIVNKLDLFYGGIDLIYDNNGELIFCEANSNAQLTAISNIFKTNFASILLQAIMKDYNE